MSFSSSFLDLDGVEFRISDSLQVPTVEGLPSNFRMRDPSEFLLQSEACNSEPSQYDFSREREVLKNIKTVRETERKIAEQEAKRKQLSLKRRSDTEKQRLEEMMNQQREVLQRQRELFLEQKRRQKQENEDAESQSPDRSSPSKEAASSSRASPASEIVSEEPPPIPPRNPFLRVGKDDILMPQKTEDPTASPSQDRVNQSQPVLTSQDQIWVDFEDYELDPFSNMELKTIDDMAELQTVLQNAKIDPPKVDTTASNRDYLPSYDEATSPTFSERSAPTGSSVGRAASDTTAETSLKTSPLYSDVETISSKSQTIVKDGETDAVECNLPPGGAEQTYENIGYAAHNQPVTSNLPEGSNLPQRGSNQTYENVGYVANNQPQASNQPQDDSNLPVCSESSEFVMPEIPETLFKNVSIAEVGEIAKQLERPSSRPLNSHNTNESLYDLAKDTGTDKEDDKTTQIRSIFEKNLSPKAKESLSNDQQPVYAVIRPKTRALRSPDGTPASSKQQIPVSSSLNQSNPVPASHIQSQPTSSENLIHVVPRQTRSRPEVMGVSVQGQINSAFPPLNHYTPSGVTKVLPVSFGGVSKSTSAPVLPPISTVSNGANYINLAPGSLSAPNLIQAPIPAPRRPPVPPRDPITTETCTTTLQTPSPHAPVASSPNGPGRPSTLGHTHLFPPYALPQDNGPNVALSPTTATFTNRKSSPTVQKVTTAPSSVAASFIQKSQEDRAKFAATVNKALSSLPKNPPKPIVMHKPTTPTHHMNESRSKPLTQKSSLFAALSSEEQEFVENITSMGFDIQATIRAMHKYGLHVKEVVDHLCNVQDIVEQGFSSNTVQDALEMFEKDNKSVAKYLQQASQLIDMGFKEGDVREALKLNNNDQTKALDQLMGQS